MYSVDREYSWHRVHIYERTMSPARLSISCKLCRVFPILAYCAGVRIQDSRQCLPRPSSVSDRIAIPTYGKNWSTKKSVRHRLVFGGSARLGP